MSLPEGKCLNFTRVKQNALNLLEQVAVEGRCRVVYGVPVVVPGDNILIALRDCWEIVTFKQQQL